MLTIIINNLCIYILLFADSTSLFERERERLKIINYHLLLSIHHHSPLLWWFFIRCEFRPHFISVNSNWWWNICTLRLQTQTHNLCRKYFVNSLKNVQRWNHFLLPPFIIIIIISSETTFSIYFTQNCIRRLSTKKYFVCMQKCNFVEIILIDLYWHEYFPFHSYTQQSFLYRTVRQTTRNTIEIN